MPKVKSVSVRVLLLGAALTLTFAGAFAGQASAFDIKAGVSKESGPFDLFKFGFKAYKNGQKEDAVEAYRYAAEKGHTGSRWALANMYADGDGVAKNDYEAFKIYSEIANQASNRVRKIPAFSSTRFCRWPTTIVMAFPTARSRSICPRRASSISRSPRLSALPKRNSSSPR